MNLQQEPRDIIESKLIADIEKECAQNGLTNLHRYHKPLGVWIWQQKAKWKRMPVEKREALLKLAPFKGFLEPEYDYELEEWNRMFGLCKQFETEHKNSTICFSQTFQGCPIGRWITKARETCKTKPGSHALFGKLNSLRTLQNWHKERKKTQSEELDEMFDNLKRRYQPYPSANPNRNPNSKPKTPYEILQVQPDASIEVIRAAYKSLCLKYHPDKPTGNAEMFKQVHGAYETLRSNIKF
jgi:hypothetical protein